MTFHTRAPRVEWRIPACIVCCYRLIHFKKQMKLRKEDFQAQRYYMKDLQQLTWLTTNKTPNHSVLALYSKNLFAFFHRIPSTVLLGLPLGVLKSLGFGNFFYRKSAMNKICSISSPSGCHYKVGGKTAFTI